MIPLWLFLVITTIIFWLFRRWQEASRWDHLPGHKAITNVPFFGHFYMLRGTPVEKLMDNWKKFGGLFRLDAHMPTVWICDYEILRNSDILSRSLL
jgi:hypothetical protein